MQANNLFAIILSLAVLASSIPVSNLAADNSTAQVTICTDVDGSGACQSFEIGYKADIPVSTCQRLPDQLYKNVGTFWVQPGAYCRIWTGSDDCKTPLGGNVMVFPHEGDNFHDFDEEDFGSQATAYTCQRCNSCP